jgi:hypothetical protein
VAPDNVLAVLTYGTGPLDDPALGYAIARAYAGHTDTGGDNGATASYVRASLPEKCSSG